MESLQKLRDAYGKPMTITSGYRCENHPIEAKKAKGGYHTKGIACDVSCGSQQAYDITDLAKDFNVAVTYVSGNESRLDFDNRFSTIGNTDNFDFLIFNM
jgi:hypothetical protein